MNSSTLSIELPVGRIVAKSFALFEFDSAVPDNRKTREKLDALYIEQILGPTGRRLSSHSCF